MILVHRFARGAALALAAILSFSLSACGGKHDTAHEEDQGDAAHADAHSADAHGEHAAEAKDAPHDEAAAGHGAAGKHGAGEKRGSADKHGAAGKHGAKSGHGGESQGGGKHGAVKNAAGPDATGLIEVDLGEFTITQRQEDKDMILMIRFQIFGVIDYEKRDKFEKLLGQRRQRVRDAVITIVQGAEVEQLSDPSLGWLKSEIVPAVNKLLAAKLLKEVVFSDFAMLQN